MCVWTCSCNRIRVNTSNRLECCWLTWCDQWWLYVTAVTLILCGQTLSEVAGGNFTPCKQEKETAEQSTPEGYSLPSNLRSTFLTSVVYTGTYIFGMFIKMCELEVLFVQLLGERWSETTDWRSTPVDVLACYINTITFMLTCLKKSLVPHQKKK